MTDAESIHVNDMAAFCELVDTGEVVVFWSVSADIGPDTIGSHRTVEFCHGKRAIANGFVTDHLTRVLCEGLHIPAESRDHFISGEGDVRRNGEAIEVAYEWTRAIPYQFPSESGHGVFTLLEHPDD